MSMQSRAALVALLLVASPSLVWSPLASAQSCDESVAVCTSGLESTPCTSDCTGECWSLGGDCTHDDAIPVDGVCECADDRAFCQRAHGRLMAKLYRLSAQAHKRCIKRADDAGAGCPDAQAGADIEQAQRVAERRAARACGGSPSGAPQVALATQLLECVQASEDSVPCRRIIARQTLRHAGIVSRSTSQCLKETLTTQGGERQCPRGDLSNAIERSLARRNLRIATVCGPALLNDISGSCSLASCDRSSDSVAYRVDSCAECCADHTIRSSIAAAFGDIPTVCGDGTLSDGEQCDDGNSDDGDGCSSECEAETTGHDPQCPNVEEMVVYAGVYGACTTNADCPVGTCDGDIDRCRTATDFDRGWTGISHNLDWNRTQIRRLALECPLDAEPGCGTCQVLGLAPLRGECRCENDRQIICDEPFAVDNDDCGGNMCQCFAGPPVPFVSGNLPTCIVERYGRDPSGTVNVDSGERSIDIRTRVLTYTGENLVTPCPYCDGDTVAGDGIRDGLCVLGEQAGAACDADARNDSFPAPGGGDTSLDCFPASGKNGSGTGLKINWAQTTGAAVLEPSGDWACGFPPILTFDTCHCGLCDNDGSVPCSSHADCPEGGLCGLSGSGTPLPSQCAADSTCVLGANGEGVCDDGPVDRLCDGRLRADGSGFISCLSDADCEADNIGVDAGACTLERLRPCFPERIEREGRSDASNPVLASITCLPTESNAGRNSVHGQPGPAARRWEARATFWCADNPEVEYLPGIGGCVAP
jgi:cysteine-rich repeat protein